MAGTLQTGFSACDGSLGRCPRSGLRADELVHPGDRLTSVDGDLLVARPSPTDLKRVAAIAEQRLYVLRSIAEAVPRGVPHAASLTFTCDDPAAVAVNEPSQEWLPVAFDDLLLPTRQRYFPPMLPPRAVLRNQAEPVLRIEGDFGAAGA